MSKEMRQYIDNFRNFLTENSKKKLNISDVSESLSSIKDKDVYNLYDEVYSKVKEHYKSKKESFIEAKVDDILTIIWRHYDYKPSKEQLRVEINNQLS